MNGGAQGNFANNYFECREKFRSSVDRLSLPLQSITNPTPGPDNEVLTTDTALVGDPEASNLVILTSGLHGLEAFAGSGIQVNLLSQYDWTSLGNTSVLFVHVLNPWGAAHLRRQNEDNVDVNRNFRRPADSVVENRYYDMLHPIIHVPDLFIGTKRNPKIEAKIATFRRKWGEAAFQSALFSGQNQHADGIGYCGLKPTWSNETIRSICEKYGAGRKRIALVDLHTGLGAFGHGALFYSQTRGGSELKLARDWFGTDLIAVRDGQSLPYEVDGDMVRALPSLFSSSSTAVGAALEFGTFEVSKLMQPQIDDSWLISFGTVDSPIYKQVKQSLIKFFFPKSDRWQQLLCTRSEQVLTHLLSRIQA